MDAFRIQSLVQEWVVLAAAFTLFAWIVYMVAATIRRKQQDAMQKHLLDKFSTAKDFADFVQSPAGQKYVMGFTDAVSSPRNSILSSVKSGIVLLFLGAGFLKGSPWLPIAHALHTLGNILAFVGVGFLISALVSYFLAKKIGPEEKV